MGLGLSVAQQHIKIEGCAIEIRLYAEDPENDFTPSTGVISGFKFPLFKWLRLEHALQQQDTVTGLFDPMLCKIITHGENRGVAIARMQSVLRESYLHGITSNLGFLSHILHSPRFISNNISVESAGFMAIEYAAERYLPVEVVLGYTIVQLYGQSIALNSTKHSQSVWSSFGGWAAIKRLSFYYNDHYMVNGMVQQNQPLKCKQLIISGGVKSFLDGFYLLNRSKLPAIYGQASGFLKYARGDYNLLKAYVEGQAKGLLFAKSFLQVRD